MWTKKHTDRLIKTLLFIGAYMLVWWQFQNAGGKTEAILRFFDNPKDDFFTLVLILLLMLVNWGVEAKKWQYMAQKLESFTFFKAFRAVMSGVTAGMFTPNRTGEFAGRVLYLQHKNRVQGSVLSIISSFSQFFTTLLFGIPALIVFLAEISSPHVFEDSLFIAAGLSVLTAVFLMLLYFNMRWIYSLLIKIPWLSRHREAIHYLKDIPRRDLLNLLLLSIFRYLVFITQFFLVCKVFQLNIGFGAVFIGAANLYFLMSMLPVFTLGEPGLRGSLTGIIFQAFTVNIAGIISASVMLWIINVLFVALVGALFLLNQKIINYESKTSR
ncbi:MAG TPA: lysylphosphatidylglycerol synthase domain-containing protein [Bacteroidales bacterium]|nr:lysylphosphatidylglycerol synthase domain-containing protein [Bacteroidales bacterium]